MGIARTFQNLRIFKALTVMDNVLVGQHLSMKTNAFDVMFHGRHYKAVEAEAREKASKALALVGLEKNTEDFAGALPYGAQKRLELARALVMDPKLLMLDEPTAGLHGVESEELMMLVKQIQTDNQISIILIEHNMKLMMKLSDRVLVMDADLQHPVDVVPQMLRCWEEGYDDVYGNRRTRGRVPLLRRKLTAAYYKMLSKSTRLNVLPNVGDFRLLDRRCVEALRAMRESQRNTKGLLCWVGFRKKGIDYDEAERHHGRGLPPSWAWQGRPWHSYICW